MNTTNTRAWPDLSHYGIYFGIITMPNGEPRLIMVDETNSWSSMARTMGFKQSRWVGLWVKQSLKFDIPNFSALFPRGKKVYLSDAQIYQTIRERILSRQSHRLSQLRRSPQNAPWHPTRRAPAKPVQEAPEVPVAVPADVAVRQTLYLGLNQLGQDVYESGDGKRFIKVNEQVAATETDENSSPLFLRSRNAEDLVACAAGLVSEIVSGKTLHSEDFERYLKAVFGPEAPDAPLHVTEFHAALDAAMMARVGDTDITANPRETFISALRLHEGRPSYWRAAGTLPTPLPLAAILQSIALTRHSDGSRAIDIAGRPAMHSWSIPNSTTVSGGEIPKHDLCVGGIFSERIPEKTVSGVRVSRADHERILSSLENRTPEGISAFIIAGGSKPGKVDSDMRRLLAHIGARYEIQGMIDVDAHMIAPGNDVHSRMIVVGNQRKEIDYTWATPIDIQVCYDYDTLWKWAENVMAVGLGDDATFGVDDREKNRWQAPYIPSSQVSEPQAMCPRNLLGPVRKALARIVDEFGVGIDEYVSTKLQWDIDDMGKYLDAEQVDAVALAIHAIDRGEGFVEADQTGMGKGRVLAAVARYGKLLGHKVVFLSEKSKLFRDFYRDIKNIGELDIFKNPLIINESIRLVGEDKQLIARTQPKEERAAALLADRIPDKYDIVLATYSQFNRPGSTHGQHVARKAALRCLDMMASGATRNDLLPDLEKMLGTDLSLQSPVVLGIAHDNQAAIRALEGALTAGTLSESEQLQLHYRKITEAALEEEVKQKATADLSTLKQDWIRGDAIKDAILILDESHNAAGPDSQTNENLSIAVTNAKAVGGYSSATFAKGPTNFGIYRRIFPSTVDYASIGDVLERGGAPLQEILSAMLAEDGKMIRREHDLSNIRFEMSVDSSRKERNEMWANRLAEVFSAMSLLSGEIEDIANDMNEATVAKIKATLAAAQANNPALAANGKITKKAISALQSTTPVIGVQYTNFSSKFYNLTRLFQMVVNADLTSELALKALQEGRKPVITVENTNETALRHILSDDALLADNDDSADGDDNDDADAKTDKDDAALIASHDPMAGLAGTYQPDLVDTAGVQAAGQTTPSTRAPRKNAGPSSFPLGRRVSFKDILRRYADSIFYAEEVTKVGKKVIGKKKVVSLRRPSLEKGINEVYRLIESLPEIPISPLDYVRQKITSAGFTVDEISGRKMALTTDAAGNHVIVRMPERNDHAIIDGFNNGTLDAAILSIAGSTGISLHASEEFADQSQRELIEMQAAADIAKRLQFWGRVNRKGQVCHPIIHFVSSGLPGEMRLLTMQNSALRKMSANISGNADNSAINENVPDILNKVGNEVCLRWLESNPKIAKLVGVSVADITEAATRYSGTRFVDRLTGRIMMFDVASQHRIYREISSEFDALVEQYELEGRNPLKSSELDIKARRGTSIVAHTPIGAQDSVFNKPVVATEIEYTVKLDPMPKDAVKNEADEAEAELVKAHGKRYVAQFQKEIKKKAAEHLPTLLSKKYATIDAALAAEEPNAVKNFARRMDWLMENLAELKPGKFIALRPKDLSHMGETMAIVGLVLPTTNITSLSEYKVKVRSPYNRTLRTLTFSSLYNGSHDLAYEFTGSSKYVKEDIEKFLKAFEKESVLDYKNVILEGNLFKAAEIADARKVGSAVTYTDEKGIWHHAILMPRGLSLLHVRDFPIEIADAKMLQAAIEQNEHILIADNFKNENQSYYIRRSGHTLEICMKNAEKDTTWILSNASLTGMLVGGKFNGTRANRSAVVEPTKLKEFCELFMRISSAARARPYLRSERREWADAYVESQRPKSAQELAAAAIDAAKATDELESLESDLFSAKMK